MAKITGHMCGGMFYVIIMGRLWFLVQDYVHKSKTQGKVQTKFPAGKGESGETPEQTFNREIWEESLEGDRVDLIPHIEFYHSKFVPDEKNSGGTYEMRFNLIDGTRCPGLLRTGEKNEDSGTELGAPYLLPVNDLAGDEGELHWSHRPALAAAILHLTDKKKVWSISRTQLEWCRRQLAEKK